MNVLPTLCALTLGLTASCFGDPMSALIVGGGPNREYNQIAIESNVRYVSHLLPKETTPQILYADGRHDTPIVLYQDARGRERYQKSNLAVINGPSRLASFQKAFGKLAAPPQSPLLLYFTGHGSPEGDDRYVNNAYDLWGDDILTVKKLASEIKTLPAHTQVTLIMVQCFSGAFGNLLFNDANPKSDVTDKDFCGFFASVPNRAAAGCTSEVNEQNYHDFTSYFFAALSGQDRSGHPVSGADYNHDGKVGMNEAYAYTLAHDISIDTPLCTSDVFLHHFVPLEDSATMATRYRDVQSWASPAQRAALDSLSTQLGLNGDERLRIAYRKFTAIFRDRDDDESERSAHWIRFVRLAKSVVLAHELAQHGPKELQDRFTQLLLAESRNPLQP